MKNYYPERMELGPRDVVARAIFNEIASGRGTKHGGIWLDVTHLPKAKILERLPTMYKQFKQYGWNRHIQGENGGCTYCTLFDGWGPSR